MTDDKGLGTSAKVVSEPTCPISTKVKLLRGRDCACWEKARRHADS